MRRIANEKEKNKEKERPIQTLKIVREGGGGLWDLVTSVPNEEQSTLPAYKWKRDVRAVVSKRTRLDATFKENISEKKD